MNPVLTSVKHSLSAFFPVALLTVWYLFGVEYAAGVMLCFGIMRVITKAFGPSRGLARLDVFGVVLCLAALLTWVTQKEIGVRLYPVLSNAVMLFIFAKSCLYPPTIIENFARFRRPDLPESAIRYTRKVTLVWCAFFIVNGGIALYTAVYSSFKIWAIYNGGISYILIASLLAGEFLLRRLFISPDQNRTSRQS